LRIANR